MYLGTNRDVDGFEIFITKYLYEVLVRSTCTKYFEVLNFIHPCFLRKLVITIQITSKYIVSFSQVQFGPSIFI